MTKLDALYLEHGQSAWVDNIRRDWLNDGTLQNLVDRGVRGVTSNPSIFAKAVASTDAYDALITSLATTDPEVAFEQLAVEDVRDACAILRPVYDASLRSLSSGERRSLDGYVSLEVSPRLAHDTEGTVAAAKRLAGMLSESPNLMIKIPATKAGLPAITAVLALGINVNVTLIFSLERYREVLDAFVEGIESAHLAGLDVSKIASVASFFISRVDTAIDPMLPEDSKLRGIAAIAQAAQAYEIFQERIASPRFTNIHDLGAQVQRPLWASTSTKNPEYSDLLYVDTLVARETVNTLPDPTLEAYADHGDAANSQLLDESARRTLGAKLEELANAGIDLAAVTQRLEDEGVAAFISSYDELLATVAQKLLG
jgi:transaldolase